MTVGELIAELQRFPSALKVKALWDTIPDFDVHRVGMFRGEVVIDCGSGPDGDWDCLEDLEQSMVKP